MLVRDDPVEVTASVVPADDAAPTEERDYGQIGYSRSIPAGRVRIDEATDRICSRYSAYAALPLTLDPRQFGIPGCDVRAASRQPRAPPTWISSSYAHKASSAAG
jgi:hypothetical protein